MNPQSPFFFLPETTSNVSISKSEFQMSYLNRETTNRPTPEYLSLYSDWDLDAAFLNSSKPFLAILLSAVSARKSLLSPSSPHTANATIDEWDVITAHDLQPLAAAAAASQSLSSQQHFNIDSCKSLDMSVHDRSGSFRDQKPRKSAVSLWSNTADKAVSVFQKVFNGKFCFYAMILLCLY